MPFTNLNTIIVKGTYFRMDGEPATGTVTLRATLVLRDPLANEIVWPTVLSEDLVNGHFEMAVPATDDPDVTPTGFIYTVTEDIEGQTNTYTIELPRATPGGQLDLADVIPVQGTVPGATYILQSVYSWQGAWDPGTAYVNRDTVSHEGSSWLATGDTVAGQEPGVDGVWEPLAMKGEPGITVHPHPIDWTFDVAPPADPDVLDIWVPI